MIYLYLALSFIIGAVAGVAYVWLRPPLAFIQRVDRMSGAVVQAWGPAKPKGRRP